jgi:hypothetical protein
MQLFSKNNITHFTDLLQQIILVMSGTILGGTTKTNYLQGTTGMGFNGTTSFTGFSLLPTTGTITGFIKVYGLAN